MRPVPQTPEAALDARQPFYSQYPAAAHTWGLTEMPTLDRYPVAAYAASAMRAGLQTPLRALVAGTTSDLAAMHGLGQDTPNPDPNVTPGEVAGALGLMAIVAFVAAAGSLVGGYFVGAALAPEKDKRMSWGLAGVGAALVGGVFNAAPLGLAAVAFASREMK